MVRIFSLLLVLVLSSSLAQELSDSGVPDYTDLKYAKPSSLPLSVYAALECRVSTEIIRDSAERAITRAGIEPISWPTVQGEQGWFGLYVALECVEGSDSRLDVAFIDSIDGTLELYGSVADNPVGRIHSDRQHMQSGHWLSSPPPDGVSGPYPLLYLRMVERVVDKAVSEFLTKRFKL